MSESENQIIHEARAALISRDNLAWVYRLIALGLLSAIGLGIKSYLEGSNDTRYLKRDEFTQNEKVKEVKASTAAELVASQSKDIHSAIDDLKKQQKEDHDLLVKVSQDISWIRKGKE